MIIKYLKLVPLIFIQLAVTLSCVAQKQNSGFTSLFNGENLNGWEGNKGSYKVENGLIVIDPNGDTSGGNLFTEKEYDNYIFQFEFQLTPGANNGLGIHMAPNDHAAYDAMELQILDDTASKYEKLETYQYHGSVYGVIPAKRGYLKPVGEWNHQEVTVNGSKIKIVLNGTIIVDGDYQEAGKNGTLDHKNHPGLKKTSGRIGFLGHGDVVRFKNIKIKELTSNK